MSEFDFGVCGATHVLLPGAHALLELRQKEVVVQLEERLDVAEHLRDQLLWEHAVRPVLLVHAELEHLERQSQRGSLFIPY